MTNDSTPAPLAEALTDSQYVLSLIDETFSAVPQIKDHHDRMRKIAAALATQPGAAPAPAPLVDMGAEMAQVIPMANGYSLSRSAGRFQWWRLNLNGEEVRRLTPFEGEFVDAALATAPAAAPIEAEPACPKCHIHPDSAMARMTTCIRKDCSQTAPEVPQEAVAARPFEFEGNRRAVAAVREAAGEVVAWLFEHDGTIADMPCGGVAWACIKPPAITFGRPDVDWTHDANKAIRFARREDAEAFRTGYLGLYPRDWDLKAYRVTEHMWPGNAHASLGEPERLTSMLMEMVGRISTALGINEEDQSCANGDDEILDAIEALKSDATLATPAKLEGEPQPGPATDEDLAIYQSIADNYAAPQARSSAPLTEAQIEEGRRATFSTDNPFCPCERKTMLKAVRWAERKHGILAADSTETK